MTTLERILAMLSAASTAPVEARALYLATARVDLDALRAEVANAERLLVAQEQELVRVSRA